MNNAVLPHVLADGQAAEIINLFLENGAWHDVCEPEVMLDLSSTYFANMVKIVQWKPARLPADCVDDFVYVVFYADNTAKMVYRGTESDTVYTLLIKARISGTSTYIAINVSGITVDVDGASPTGTTPASPAGGISRRYYGGETITATCPATSSKDGYTLGFFRWINLAGAVISTNRVLGHEMASSLTLIAEYVITPFIRIEDADGNALTSLDDFYSMPGQPSEAQSYFVGGIGLDADLYIYPPEGFEISLDGDTWVQYGDSILIAKDDAEEAMTEILVRYKGE